MFKKARVNPILQQILNTLHIRKELIFINWGFTRLLKHITKETILLTSKLRDYLDGNPKF